jgi:putative tryptophan/tyrosine transport system substrate-binding protein
MTTPERRAFLVAALGFPLWQVASAQDPQRRLGGLFGGSPRTHKRALDAFLEALAERGWRDGRNLVLDVRWAEGRIDRVPALAADVVRARPDVILTAGNPVIAEVRKATQKIPIVMATGSDPVGAGFVASLARPGGNLTGVTGFYESTPAKMLELASELVPPGASIAAVFERNTLFSQPRYRDALARTAARFHLLHAIHEVAAPADLDRVLQSLGRERPHALLILPGPMIFAFYEAIVRQAESLGMPVVYPFEEMAEAGGLMSYAPNLLDSYRSAARYVDRILRGENPAGLAMEQPTRLSLAVNLRTAKARRIELPASIIRRADRVID